MKTQEEETKSYDELEEYIIHCPKCEVTHDVSEQMNVWKREFFEEVNEIVKRKLGENEKL